MKIISWIIMSLAIYFAGFYSGLNYRGSSDRGEAVREHLNHVTKEAKAKGAKIIKVIQND
jgi:hypothetical protein